MPARRLEPLVVPFGAPMLGLLDPLRRALDGSGPALLPVPGADPAAADRRAASQSVGASLTDAEDDPDDPTALVMTTSGSTGSPKGALLSRSALQASGQATHELLGGPGTWLLAMPAHHVAGMQVLLRSILAATTPGVLDLAHGFRPDAFVAATRALAAPGPRYTALVPTQLARLLDGSTTPRAALASYDGVLIGGAAAPAHLLKRAHDAGVRLFTTYGTSETCGGCVYTGTPLRSVRTALDERGTVRLGGPVLARGYRLQPEHPAFVIADGARWFQTDDVATIADDGTLEVMGRLDDVITTGGVKVAPAAVEEVLAAAPGVREVVVVGVADPQWGQRVVAAIVPIDGDDAPTTATVRDFVGARLGRPCAPRQVLLLPQLPLRGPGKPDRRALIEAAAAAEAAPATASRS